jgi:DNA end-binding protein Ku
MKAVWSGALSFGLMDIPLKLYAAVQPRSGGFALLCKECKRAVVYERWCRMCNKRVLWTETVKGIKKSNTTYHIFTQEQIKRLKPSKSNVIVMEEFIPYSELYLLYIHDHYYGVPTQKDAKEFFLFREALRRSHVAAIGTFAMHEKEYVCAIMPYKEALLVTTLNYAYEIKPIETIMDVQEQSMFSSTEMSLAQELITQNMHATFHLEQFKDNFRKKLSAALKKGERSAHFSYEHVPMENGTSQSESLAGILRASIEKKKQPPFL